MFFEKKLKIHQVAELYHCSNRTLQYYDEAGLLSPKRTESGHRYYTMDDLDTLDAIFSLKRAGFRLAEIKNMLSDENPKHRGALLELQITHLQEEIKQLQRTVDRLHQMKEDLLAIQSHPFGTLLTKECANQHYQALSAPKTTPIIVTGGSDILVHFNQAGEMLYLSQPSELLPGTRTVAYAYLEQDRSTPEQLCRFIALCHSHCYLPTSDLRARECSWICISHLYIECDVIPSVS